MTLRQRNDSQEGVCDDCGNDYVTPWYAPNGLWNRVVGSPNGMLCPNCFIERAEPVFAGRHPIWKVNIDDVLPETKHTQGKAAARSRRLA